MARLNKVKKLNMPIKFRLGIFFCIFFLCVIIVFVYLNKVVNPVIIESSSAKTRALSQRAVEDAMLTTIKDNIGMIRLL